MEYILVMKQWRITIMICIGMLILLHPVTIDALLAFLFAGIIPGTTIALPFWAMCVLLATIGYIAIRWVTKDPVYIGDTNQQSVNKRLAARKYVMQKINPPAKTSHRPMLRRRKRTYRVATS